MLVHAGLSCRSDRLVIEAAELANQFGAKLIGVSTPAVCRTDRDGSGIHARAIDVLLAAARERFTTLSSSVRGGFLWDQADSSPVEALGAFAWAADLIIVDHQDMVPGRSWSGGMENLLENCGRPVLVRPENPDRGAFDRIVVVWDESVACKHATMTALPFLGRAKDITLLAPPWRRRREREERQIEDVRRGLLARGLPIHVERLEDWTPSHLLLDRLNTMGADLVVMGGWEEHTPWGARGPLSAIVPKLKGHALVSC
jgi:hypothetical protein